MVIEDERADLAEGLAALEAFPGADVDRVADRRAVVEAALPPR